MPIFSSTRFTDYPDLIRDRKLLLQDPWAPMGSIGANALCLDGSWPPLMLWWALQRLSGSYSWIGKGHMRQISVWNTPGEKEAPNPRNQPRSGLRFLLVHSAAIPATPGETASIAAPWEGIFLRDKDVLLNCVPVPEPSFCRLFICNTHLGKLMLLSDASASCQVILLIINMYFWSGFHGYRKLQSWLSFKLRVWSFIQVNVAVWSSIPVWSCPNQAHIPVLCSIWGQALEWGSLIIIILMLYGVLL